MSFLTENDYKQVINESDMDDITDLSTATRLVAEESAISLAKDHLSSRYDTDEIFNKTGSQRHPSVVMMCINISIYLLHQRLHPNAIPDHRVEGYKSAKTWFENVSCSKINPVGLPLATDEDGNNTKDHILMSSETKRNNRI